MSGFERTTSVPPRPAAHVAERQARARPSGAASAGLPLRTLRSRLVVVRFAAEPANTGHRIASARSLRSAATTGAPEEIACTHGPTPRVYWASINCAAMSSDAHRVQRAASADDEMDAPPTGSSSVHKAHSRAGTSSAGTPRTASRTARAKRPGSLCLSPPRHPTRAFRDPV